MTNLWYNQSSSLLKTNISLVIGEATVLSKSLAKSTGGAIMMRTIVKVIAGFGLTKIIQAILGVLILLVMGDDIFFYPEDYPIFLFCILGFVTFLAIPVVSTRLLRSVFPDWGWVAVGAFLATVSAIFL